MSESFVIDRLQQVAKIASGGQKQEAAQLCREVLANQPDNLLALLWLGYTSPNQVEAEEAIAKAYELSPQDPHVLKAVEWYNTHFIDPATQPPPAPSAPQAPPPDRPKVDRMLQPLGEPVKDHANFLMSQTASMIIGSAIFLGSCTLTILAYSGLLFRDGVIPTPFNIRREFYAIGAFLLFWPALGFFIFSILDLITLPVHVTGFVTERKRVRKDVKGRYGTGGVEYYFEAKLIPDDREKFGEKTFHMKLTEEQYKACEQSNRGRIVCSRRLGVVRVYQPLRSVH